jgi:hypothetical protein
VSHGSTSIVRGEWRREETTKVSRVLGGARGEGEWERLDSSGRSAGAEMACLESGQLTSSWRELV